LQNRGLCLSNSEPIRNVHNSFARNHLFEMAEVRVPEKDDNFHFVTYVPIKGRVYELDGLREGPIDLGPIADGQDWLDAVRPVIEKRIQKLVHFTFCYLLLLASRAKNFVSGSCRLSKIGANRQHFC
jgi:hypothetical protein